MWVRSVVDESLGAPRVAFAIGRRNGNAVTRNRIKRRLRSAIEDRSDSIAPGLYLVGWKGRSSEPPFAELLDDVSRTMGEGSIDG